MRSKTIIIILVTLLTLALAAVAFLIGMMLASDEKAPPVQTIVMDSAAEISTEALTTAAETTATTEAVTTVTTAAETTAAATTTEPEKVIDATFYKNYYPDKKEFVYNGYVATKSDNLNLRELPTEQSEILAKIPKDTELPIYRTPEDGWYWTSYKRIHGYIRSEYIKKSDGQQLEPDDYDERVNSDTVFQKNEKTYLFAGYVNTKSDSLSMRVRPNTKSKIITKIPKGTQLEIYDANADGWYWTKYGENSGYVSAKYIAQITDKRIDSQPDTPSGDPSRGYHAWQRYGRINTHGTVVPGYTTSRIEDNGDTDSKERESLGNGWHIVSYRYRETPEGVWCELYDSEDGDYYGWVDINYIDWDPS